MLLPGCSSAGSAAAAWLSYFALTPIDVPADARELMVKPGRSARAVGRDLVAAGVLEEPWSFVMMARLLRQDNAMKAGNYELPARITPYRLLEMVARGEVSQAQITFIEGWTFAQMRAALAQHPSVAHDAGCAHATPQILRAIGASETHPEGLFFPDTYYFSPGTRELKILARAYHTMRSAAGRAVGGARAGPALRLALRGPDHGVHRGEGDRPGRRPQDDRGSVRQPAQAQHAAADRSDRDLRAGRGLRW